MGYFNKWVKITKREEILWTILLTILEQKFTLEQTP